MSDIITGLLGPQLRKWIAAACGAWITVLIERGVLTKLQTDQLIEMLIAVGIFVVTLLWTWGKNKIQSKVAVTIPVASVPSVQLAVQATSPAK